MKTFYFDLETLPCSDPAIIAELAATIKPPATYKKPESIAEWMRDNKESALNELLAKTSFDGMYGRIACAAWAVDDGAIESSGAQDDEVAVIRKIFDAALNANSETRDQVVFCGHNIAGFDLPFLKHRSIIFGIEPPPYFRAAFRAKPWEIEDTMLMWSTEREKRVSLDKLCRALDIPGKDGFDGSMVAETWPVNQSKVIEYCKDDVARTRAVHRRLQWK